MEWKEDSNELAMKVEVFEVARSTVVAWCGRQWCCFRWRRGGDEEGKYVAVIRLDDVTLCLPCHHLTERD